ncbi:MAG: IMPACT family protein [Myxococcota bacterium]|nr:IMPACT family protein [Myxococcota bacterium]
METLLAPHEYSVEIKRSRFIARAAPVTCPEAAMEFLRQASEAGADHNCWAYRVGDEYRFNDDGEPGGSAGRPILAAIDGQGLDEVAVVVTRTFGGIKLGVGGLVRAYGGTAAECLRTAQRRTLVRTVVVRLRAPFECLGAAHGLLEQRALQRLREAFDERGVVLEVAVEEGQEPALLRAFVDATRGKGSGEIVE